jgi:hypothetical protein
METAAQYPQSRLGQLRLNHLLAQLSQAQCEVRLLENQLHEIMYDTAIGGRSAASEEFAKYTGWITEAYQLVARSITRRNDLLRAVKERQEHVTNLDRDDPVDLHYIIDTPADRRPEVDSLGSNLSSVVSSAIISSLPKEYRTGILHQSIGSTCAEYSD